MLVTRFDPFRNFENNFFRTLVDYDKDKTYTAYTPSVNVREGEFAYHVDVDLPGVKKEDIDVDIKEGQLIISGERHFRNEAKEEDYYKVETRFGKFSRTFNLPDDADIEQVDASYDDGVLEVVIPKLEEKHNVKSITVK